MISANKTGLCIIGLGIYEPWIDILENGQELTWLSDPRPDSIEVLHAHGKQLGRFGQSVDKLHEKFRWKTGLTSHILRLFDNFLLFPFIFHVPSWRFVSGLQVSDPVIVVNTPDALLTLRWKELGFFDFFLKNSTADFLVTTTNSSYLSFVNLQNLLNSLPDKLLYYGPKPCEGAEFVSGSFRVFSRDVVELIVSKRIFWEGAVIEDVSLGKLLKRNGIHPIFRSICNFESVETIIDASCIDLKSQVHFRLKSGEYENRQDVKLMKLLHSRIKSCIHNESNHEEQL
jgi:hypothetical protein